MKRIVSISIGLIVTVMMFMAFTVSSFAAADISKDASKNILKAEVKSELVTGQTITATNINVADAPVYTTPRANGYTTYYYKVYMPKAGTLMLTYASPDDSVYVSLYNSSGNSKSSIGSDSVDAAKIRYYYLPAGTYTLNVSLSDLDYAALSCGYAPSGAKLLTNNKIYYHGSTGNQSSYTTIKVKAPSKGYIALDLGDVSTVGYGLYIKTKGFKDYNYVFGKDSTSYHTQYIGVKKGTYTIKVKTYSPMYGVKYKFVKTKEGAFGTKKSKAKKITKGNVRKGVIVTDAKKVHWYKFKNPKKQKVTFIYKTRLNAGGNYGGIKVTISGKGSSSSRVIYDDTASTSIKYYNTGTKLAKGTYYIKVQSYHNGTGFFSLKWK